MVCGGVSCQLYSVSRATERARGGDMKQCEKSASLRYDAKRYRSLSLSIGEKCNARMLD